MKQQFVTLLIILVCVTNSTAQIDTVRVCTYNLLNYGNAANPIAYKNQRIQALLSEIQPSLQCFNEISTAKAGLLDTLLKVLPYPSEHGSVHNTVGTTQLDGLFWKQGKFHLLKDTIICSVIRDIVAYELYWDYPDLAIYNDTVKLTVITAHLKSSSASADKADRAAETQKVSAYLSSVNKQSNTIMLGDLNLYSSSETAYQNLTNPSNINARLNDPLNRPGSWDNNSTFADIHTQSPRLAALPDGGASGGLDSRFDFILVSDPMLNGSRGIKYLNGSYKAFGNDGQHYGKALTDPPANTAVSASIAQALYECSDHLPVLADLVFTPLHLVQANSITRTGRLQDEIRVGNPFTGTIRLHSSSEGPVKYYLYSLEGILVQEGVLTASVRQIDIGAVANPGYYILRVVSITGEAAHYKLVRL